MSQSAQLPTESPEKPSGCDCHFHVFSACACAVDARYVPNYSVTLQDWEIRAQGVGVVRGVVVQPSFLGTDNRQLLRALAQRPQTLRGVAVVDSSATLNELLDLHHAGVRGVRLNLMGAQDDVGALRALPDSWWSALIAADMHLELHADIGRTAALLPMVPSDLDVVLDHFAKPDRADSQDDTVRAVGNRKHSHGATYVTLSGAYRQAACNRHICAELAALWLDELGADQLLWGSDWPCTNYESEVDFVALVAALHDWLPDLRDNQAALTVNAHRLFWR